jgi:hypothetical protein
LGDLALKGQLRREIWGFGEAWHDRVVHRLDSVCLGLDRGLELLGLDEGEEVVAAESERLALSPRNCHRIGCHPQA